MFSVRGPGIVSLPLAAIPGSPSADMVHVAHGGQDVPVQIAGDMLWFVAPASDNPASAETTYQVWADSTRPARRTTLPRVLTRPFVWERDMLYQSVAPTARGDRWFAGELRDDVPLETITSTPPGMDAGTVLRISVTPLVRGTHTITALVDDQQVGQVTWNDATAGPRQVELVLEHDVLPGRALYLAGAYDDLLMLDRLEMPTVRIALPVLPTPVLRPISTHDLRTGPAAHRRGATYLIITHPTFRPALDPLIAAHQQRGETVAVVEVQDIYDQFSSGERDPEAIRVFVRATQQAWLPAPRTVLLVGAGNVRMRIEAGEADVTFIPPYLLAIDPKYGEVACDTCYGRTEPRVAAQLVPDVAIGRLPVRTLEEARTVVDKTVTALTQPPAGAWRQRAILLADDDDSAGSFQQLRQDAAAILRSSMQPRSFTYRPRATPAPGFYANPHTLRTDLFRAWDDGAALILYAGHGGLWQWGATDSDVGIEHLVGLYDADSRTNGNRLPILLAMDCLSGNWANPTLQAIDERMVVHTDGGVVAALTPTGSAVATRHSTMHAAVIPALLAGQSLGAAHLAGLRVLAAQSQQPDLLFTYGILGDPAIIMPSRAHYMPLVVR